MEIFNCPDGCCTIKVNPCSIYKKNMSDKVRTRRCKAGVFMYDPKTDKVLLVQSRGHLWGLPKGTINYNETERQCAVREVSEETGLKICSSQFTRAVKIQNRSIYFYMEYNECDVEIQNQIIDNDANGIAWIKPSCLEKCIENGNISLNQHCRIVFRRLMNREFTHSTFIVVNNSKKSSRFTH